MTTTRKHKKPLKVISTKIPLALREQIAHDAESRNVTPSTRINQILTRYYRRNGRKLIHH